MKTAVCISGQPRDIAQTWRSWWDNFVSLLPSPDVFIYSSEPYPVGKEFFDTVKPKAYIVESQVSHQHVRDVLWDIGYFSEVHMNAFVQQTFGLRLAWELKYQHQLLTGTAYSHVVRLRPDLLFLRPVSPATFDPERVTNLHAAHDPKFCMEFAFGPERHMDKYFKVYDWLGSVGQGFLLANKGRTAEWGGKYDCDTVMATYLLDYCRVPRAAQPEIDGPPASYSPYSVYRVFRLHQSGVYG